VNPERTMTTSPVTISYEYERPRFAYEVAVDGEQETVEADWCRRHDGRYVFGEAADIVPAGTGARLEHSEVFACNAAAVEGLDAVRVGETVLELQFIRRPSLVERLAPWTWPPAVDGDAVDDETGAGTLVHPEDDVVSVSGDVIHSLEPMPADG
jgi:hypothetical protein